MKRKIFSSLRVCILSLASFFPAYAQDIHDINEGQYREIIDFVSDNANIYIDENWSYLIKNFTLLHINPKRNSYMIYGLRSEQLHLTADEGKWNTLTSDLFGTKGIFLEQMKGLSTISRTKIVFNDTASHGVGIQAEGLWGTTYQGTRILLEDVKIYLTEGYEQPEAASVGIRVINSSSITNQGSVVVQGRSVKEHQILLEAQTGSKIDLNNAHLGLKNGVALQAVFGSTISLSDSSITSSSNNILVTGGLEKFFTEITEIMGIEDVPAYSNRSAVTLNNVDLSNARNQRITAGEGHLGVNLENGTCFDGYVSTDIEEIYWERDNHDYHLYGPYENGNVTLNINAAGWNVTRDSDLGKEGVLDLSNKSFLNLYALGGTDFTDIYAASIMIEQGTVINLDVSAFEGGEGTYAILHADEFGQYNAATVNLIGADNSPYIWDTSRLATEGTVTVRLNMIPEPGTALLGLFGLAGCVLRRRRV